MNKHDLKAAAIVQDAFASGKMMEAGRAHDGAVVVSTAGRSPAKAAADAAVDEAVRAHQREQEQAAQQLRDEASTRLGRHRDWMLRGMLGDMHERGEVTTADPEALEAAGALKGYVLEDGAQVWEVNGAPALIFERPTGAFDHEFFNVNQVYRVRL